MTLVGGPWFEDFAIGDRLDGAPAITLTSGLAAAHHAIVGGRLRLAFDAGLSRRVMGSQLSFASPALVWDIAIGQSTLVTQRAIANLYYRGLVFLRTPSIGDTLSTVTTIVGLRPVSPKPGRPPRGLVAMRIQTADQHGRPVLDFHRCAMLPARAESTRPAEGITEMPSKPFLGAQLEVPVADWNIGAFGHKGGSFAGIAPGDVWTIEDGDVVSNAPELARLTMNLAAIHHDHRGSGERLVYGGHSIGLALSQATRALPSLVTVVAWSDCDHLGPVREGDTLHSEITVEDCTPRAAGGGFVHLRARVKATGSGGQVTDVLDWRFVGLLP